MKKFFRRFLGISARFTGKSLEKRIEQDGTLGLGDYISLTLNGLMLILAILVFGVIFLPIILFVACYVAAAKKIKTAVNLVRIKVD